MKLINLCKHDWKCWDDGLSDLLTWSENERVWYNPSRPIPGYTLIIVKLLNVPLIHSSVLLSTVWNYGMCVMVFWDCPGGVEENNCNKTSSPNRYKCRNSSIFVSLESICDKIKDCPDVDDESSCDLKNIECPGRCRCLLYAAACDGISGFPWSLTLLLPYQHIHLTGCAAWAADRL